ncbi:MAG: DUF2461 domain-containing protein [Ignavibacteria bacterium]|nr:DUF2461 domain-containing protein [Ignavibacteria bacterium]
MKEYEFPFNTIQFLSKLAKNNNREWFHAHRNEYEKNFLLPAKMVVIELGSFIREYFPQIIAEPEINKSIFRLNRDTRFSKDKKPYKTNLGIYFWEGKRKKLECSGFYFHIEPKSFLIAVGFYIFPPDILKKYRHHLLQLTKNSDLYKIISKLKSKGYSIEEKKFKKLPSGFTSEHPFAELSTYSGLYAMFETNDFDQFKEKDIIEFSKKIIKDMMPLHKWIVENLY